MGQTRNETGPVATVIIVDDHPMVRGAMRQALSSEVDAGPQGRGPVRVIEAEGPDALRSALATTEEVDLVLLDLAMPGVSGLSGLMALRAEHPSLPVMVVSATSDEATVGRAMRLGASGFIPKSSGLEEIRDAVGTVLRGDLWQPAGTDAAGEAARGGEVDELVERLAQLTPQQSRVLAMMAQGLLNKQIAYELSVSEATVKAHVSAVLAKLGVDSRTQAVIALNRLGADVVSAAAV